MGKQDDQLADVAEELADSHAFCWCCTRSAWQWPLPVILGIYVLAFAIGSIRFRSSSGDDPQPPSPPLWIPHVEASFRLRRSVSVIYESLPQLQVDLQNEIGIPNTQIDIISIVPLPSKNWTEVRFKVSPESSNDFIAPADLSLLKDTFVELFMQRSANLSLTSMVFGKVSHFEVLNFPGGITVVPPQPGFPLSKVVVLFNFTLHNSLSHVNHDFTKFRCQLADGIILKPNESLFVQLTNLEGSTVKSPVVVQTSILPVVGVMLPRMRLKQLAREIIASPKRNLGLNDTLFGRVKKIQLSSYLVYSLESVQTPSPSPSPAPSFSPDSPPEAGDMPRLQGSKRHRQYSPSIPPAHSPSRKRRTPTWKGMAPTPEYLHHNRPRHNAGGALSPSYPPFHPYLHSPLSSPSSFGQPYWPPLEAPSQSRPLIAPSAPGKIESQSPAPAKPSIHAEVPSEAPLALVPSSAPRTSKFHKTAAFAPVPSPLVASSASILLVPAWILAIGLALLLDIG